MAAPASILSLGFTFRDSKGLTGHMRMLIGGASVAAIFTAYNSLQTALQAVSNAFVHQNSAPDKNYTYGTSARYDTIEDKAALTFRDEWGALHRYQIPAPISTIFLADQETVNMANADVATLVGLFQSNVYAHSTATAPLVGVGGIRQRRKMQRKANLFTLSSNLDEPEE